MCKIYVRSNYTDLSNKKHFKNIFLCCKIGKNIYCQCLEKVLGTVYHPAWVKLGKQPRVTRRTFTDNQIQVPAHKVVYK
jgi:predicted lipase